CGAGWLRLRGGRLDLAGAAGGALAVHALLRAGELLPAQLGLVDGASAVAPFAALVRAIGPPLLASLALLLLAWRRGTAVALETGAATALAAGGFTVTGALPLLALAAADALRWRERELRAYRGGLPRVSELALGTIAALLALTLTVLRPAAGGLAIAAALG